MYTYNQIRTWASTHGAPAVLEDTKNATASDLT